MPIGEEVRAEVWARDNGECQFWHREPTPATELAHFRHAGMGGRPDDADVNQASNLACACRECHEKLHGRYRWEAFEVDLEMLVLAPNGQAVPERDLWFYVRRAWADAPDWYLELQQDIASERKTAWRVAQRLAWFKETGVSRAVSDEMVDYLDIGASLGLSSAEVKQRVRVKAFIGDGTGTTQFSPWHLSIDVADRLRKVPEEELPEVAGWFRDLPPAEAWSRFHERYPGKERTRVYRTFTGSYTETRAASEDALPIVPGAIVVKGGSVIAGTRKEAE